MGIKVTLGLCVKNGAAVLQKTLNSITVQDYSHELMKILIVDNNSSDNTLEIAMRFAKQTDIQTVVISSSEGLGGVRQIIVDKAEGDYILWVDDDFVFPTQFVRSHVEFMEKNPNIGGARCSVKKTSSEIKIRDVFNTFEFLLLMPANEPLNNIGTGGSIFRLKALKSAGGFDVRIKGAGEDLDLSRRIKASGWVLAFNESAILPRNSTISPKRFWRRNYWYGYGNHFIYHKYVESILILQFFPFYALLGGLKTALTIYRFTKLKKSFIFPIFHLIELNVKAVGFMRAHMDGYGHRQKC